jgi:hypothetical protein
VVFSTSRGHLPYVSPPDDDLDWAGDPDRRRAQHRRHIIVLTTLITASVVLAVVVHSAILGFNLFFVPFLLLEMWMFRRSRPTSKIPDFRPPDTVEVELDPD